MQPDKLQKGVGRTVAEAVLPGQTDMSWPLSHSKNKSVCVCERRGLDLFGTNVRKQLKCVFVCVFVCLQSPLETVRNSSNSLIFLTSCHLLWQTRFLFRIVVGLFISGPVSSPLTTSLSSDSSACGFPTPPQIKKNTYIKCHTMWSPIPAGILSQILFVQVSFLWNLLTISQRLSLFSNSAFVRLPKDSHFPYHSLAPNCALNVTGSLNFCRQDMEQVALLSWRT